MNEMNWELELEKEKLKWLPGEERLLKEALKCLPKEILGIKREGVERDDFKGVAFLKIIRMRRTHNDYASKLTSLRTHLEHEFKPAYCGRITRREVETKFKARQTSWENLDRLESSPQKQSTARSLPNPSDDDPTSLAQHNEMLASFTPELRTIFEMLNAGHTQVEIAERLEVTPKTISLRVDSIEMAIKKYFEDVKPYITMIYINDSKNHAQQLIAKVIVGHLAWLYGCRVVFTTLFFLPKV